jgi:hypothetical protein
MTSMAAHPKAIERLKTKIELCRRNNWPIDGLLDQLFDVTQRATEWDAGFWGFDSDRWMAYERNEMNARARNLGFYPCEVSKYELADIVCEVGEPERAG